MENCRNIGDISYTLLDYKDKNARGRVYQVYVINTFGFESIRERFAHKNKQWAFRHLLIEKNVKLKETLLRFEGAQATYGIVKGIQSKNIMGDVWISFDEKKNEAPENYEELLAGPVKERFHFENGVRTKQKWYEQRLKETAEKFERERLQRAERQNNR